MELQESATAKPATATKEDRVRDIVSDHKRKDVHRLSRNEDRQNKSSPKYTSLGRQVGVLRLTFIVHAHREESGVLTPYTPPHSTAGLALHAPSWGLSDAQPRFFFPTLPNPFDFVVRPRDGF